MMSRSSLPVGASDASDADNAGFLLVHFFGTISTLRRKNEQQGKVRGGLGRVKRCVQTARLSAVGADVTALERHDSLPARRHRPRHRHQASERGVQRGRVRAQPGAFAEGVRCGWGVGTSGKSGRTDRVVPQRRPARRCTTAAQRFQARPRCHDFAARSQTARHCRSLNGARCTSWRRTWRPPTAP
jgi:hypothetical protein